MPIRNLGPIELLIILVLAILIFGPGRIGKIGTELGRGIRGFKEGVATDDKEKKGEEEDVEPEVKSA
jgi:sec-independent protein translocase protein TatA